MLEMKDLQFGKVTGRRQLCSQVCKTDFLFNFHTDTTRASPWAFPAKFSVGQGSSNLQTEHSSSAPIIAPIIGGWGGQESRWCEIDDLNTSSINAAANVVFGDWWRIQAIHLFYRQPSVKILPRFFVLFLHFSEVLLQIVDRLTSVDKYEKVPPVYATNSSVFLLSHRNYSKYCHKRLSNTLQNAVPFLTSNFFWFS